MDPKNSTASPEAPEAISAAPEAAPATQAEAAPSPDANAESAAPATAAEKPEKVGFLARLTGAESKLQAALNKVSALETELADTKSKLETAQATADQYAALEAELKKAEAAYEASIAAEKKKADEKIAQAEATIEPKVAAGVLDTVASMGVPEEELPESDANESNSSETSNLSGREKAAAAFNAQFAKN